jgi:hypothetical protein
MGHAMKIKNLCASLGCRNWGDISPISKKMGHAMKIYFNDVSSDIDLAL